MISVAIRLIRYALTFILEQLQQIVELWRSKERFESRPRRMIGEIGIALSILGTSHQIIAPIIGGGIPFIVAIALIAAWILAYWFRRAGISDPRLLYLSLIGIAIEVVAVIFGGVFIPHAGMNLLQHLFQNVVVRGGLTGIGSLISSTITYVVSALPGDFEGERIPDPDLSTSESSLSYYEQWQNKTNCYQTYSTS